MSPYSYLDPQSYLHISQCSQAYFYRYFEKALQCFIQTKPSSLQKTSSVGNVILSLCLSRSMANLPYSVFCWVITLVHCRVCECFILFTQLTIVANKQNYKNCQLDLPCVIFKLCKDMIKVKQTLVDGT